MTIQEVRRLALALPEAAEQEHWETHRSEFEAGSLPQCLTMAI
jgi:hypothetical protein